MLFSLNNLWVTVGREFWWHKHLCISRLSFFQGLLSVSVITVMVGKWWPPHPATRFIKSFTFPSWHCAVMRSASFSLSVDDLFVIGNTMDSDFPSTQYTIDRTCCSRYLTFKSQNPWSFGTVGHGIRGAKTPPRSPVAMVVLYWASAPAPKHQALYWKWYFLHNAGWLQCPCWENRIFPMRAQCPRRMGFQAWWKPSFSASSCSFRGISRPVT